LKSTD
jgi:hypothetical protein